MSKIGFLPLYLELYDLRSPKSAGNARVFAKQVENGCEPWGWNLKSRLSAA